MKILKIITNEIMSLEIKKYYGGLVKEDSEVLNVLNFCYDLLSRTEKAKRLLYYSPDSVVKNGVESFCFKIMANAYADKVFKNINEKIEFQSNCGEYSSYEKNYDVYEGNKVLTSNVTFDVAKECYTILKKKHKHCSIVEHENTLGEQIRLFRKAVKMTQSELAQQLNSQKTRISDFELNKRTPTLETLKKISKAIGVSMDTLIS